MKLELYVLPGCPFCKKVERYIEKHNLTDKVELKSVSDDANKKRVIEEGGQEQYPCLFIDDKPMYESGDIVRYFKENFE